MVIAAVSTIVEWYDFTLYLATVLSRVFFGGAQGALVTALAGFAVAYLLRPLGAIVFGHIGDRFGRRRMMLLSMALMTVTMLATALLRRFCGHRGRRRMAAVAAALRDLFFRWAGNIPAWWPLQGRGAKADRRGLITSCASAASEMARCSPSASRR